MPFTARDNDASSRPSAHAASHWAPGLTPERRAALDELERELAALLKATGRRAA